MNEVTQLHLLITKASVLLLHTVNIINNTELCSYTILKSDGAQPHQNNNKKVQHQNRKKCTMQRTASATDKFNLSCFFSSSKAISVSSIL